jgi:dipeptidyl aminopeptidase/acylaminoacyl peptidase
MDALGYLDEVVQDLYVVPSEGGSATRLTSGGWHYTMPRWSPDGSAILALASMSPTSHEAWLTRARLVDLHGRVCEITGEWGEVLSAAWAPDGERIVFCGKPRDRKIGSKYDLWVVNKNGAEPECRTEGLPVGVGGSLIPDMAGVLDQVFVPNILVSKDGSSGFVRVQDGGTVPIYRISLAGPESWTPLVSGEQACFLEDLHKRHLLYAVSGLFNPADLFLIEVEGGNTTRLTHLNEPLLANRELPTVHHLDFAGGDGAPVEGWFMQPRSGNAPFPTILYIHGGPHNGFGHIFCFDFLMLAAAGYAVLFINHRGSTGYGDEFANQILGDWGNLDYRDLMAGVDHVIERGLADPDRLGCCGLSGGGNLSCWIVGQTNRFKAAVPENPVTNWVSFYGVSDIGVDFSVKELGGHPHEIPEVYRRCSPITYAHRCRTPTLLIQGEADYRCPAEQSEQFYTVLKANGCVVEMLRLPASSHAESAEGRLDIRRAQNEALLSWMNRFVMGTKE